MSAVKKWLLVTFAFLAMMTGFNTSAFADNAALVTSAGNALTSAGADALSVGGYVVAAVAGLIVVSMILSMMKKA